MGAGLRTTPKGVGRPPDPNVSCAADLSRQEYLVYLPAGGEVTVDLSAAKGELAVEWFDPSKGEAAAAGTARGGARREFRAPFPGAAVLYLAAGR
jgi:hypothetical protein